MPSDHVRKSSDDQDERDRDHSDHQLVIPLKVRIVASTPSAVELLGRQEHPPLSQLHEDLIIEEHCDENCNFENNRETEPDDLAEEEIANEAQGRANPHCETALDGPCLGKPELGLEGEHDSNVALHRHDENRKKGRQ